MTEHAKQIRQEIKNKIANMHPSIAISILESLGKEMRRMNSVRISKNQPVNLIEMERPDLINIKS
jgi:hypothetical protein